MKVGVVTDSTCDLPAASLLRLGVATVPLKVVVGAEVYRDWRDIEPLTLYGWMSEQGLLPHTSPPDPADFVPVYQRYLSSYDHVVSIHLSSKLSDTIKHARQAAAELGATERITFVDSGHATAAMAEMVIAAAAEAATGSSPEAVLRAIERIKQNIYVLISPDSLHWLVQGGRIGRARGLIGNLLGLRPVLTMQQGEVATEGTTRHSAIIDTFAERLKKRFGAVPIRMTLGFAGKDRSEIERVKRALEQTDLHIVKGRVQLIGPVIGAHLGPGTTVVCAYPELGVALDV